MGDGFVCVRKRKIESVCVRKIEIESVCACVRQKDQESAGESGRV